MQRQGIDMFYAWSAVDKYLDMEELDDWCDVSIHFPFIFSLLRDCQ